MISSRISIASATWLAMIGLPLLFAPVEFLTVVVPGLPAAAAWIGQLIAAGCLSLAILNWSHRGALLGGVYGRPIVLANFTFYLISALAIGRNAFQQPVTTLVWLATGGQAIFALLYSRLLLGAPLGHDFEQFRSQT